MLSKIAPLHGTTSNYCYLEDGAVLIMKENYKHTTISQEVFNHLYFELDDNYAALKQDCIDYVVFNPDTTIEVYPKWFLEAMEDGWILNEHVGCFLFLNDYGEIAMSPGSVVLRNFMGDLRYMERNDFEKYYDILGE